jgi:hypothetical protein
LGRLGTAATNRPIVPAPGDYDDGEIGGMIVGRGNRSTRRKLTALSSTTSTCCPDANPASQYIDDVFMVSNLRQQAFFYLLKY